MFTKYMPGIPLTFSALVVEFLVCALFLLIFATKLSKYADALEKKTATSAIWIGMVFLAVVTSIPEAVASVGSALMEGALNLGAGNLFGSSTFNLSIIIILDVLHGSRPLLLGVQSGLIVGATGGILLMATVAMAIGFHQLPEAEAWGPLTGVLFTFAIVAGYFMLSRVTSKELPAESMATEGDATKAVARAYDYSSRRIFSRLGIYSALLILDAVWLLRVCDSMAIVPLHLGATELLLGRTVTGTFILSLATSLPEFFVSLAACRLGQTNMAIANLLGSNMVNVLFVPVMHVFSRDSRFYALLDPSALIVLCTAILMSGLFIVGLRVRSSKSFLFLGWETICMLAVYIAGGLLVMRVGLTF